MAKKIKENGIVLSKFIKPASQQFIIDGRVIEAQPTALPLWSLVAKSMATTVSATCRSPVSSWSSRSTKNTSIWTRYRSPMSITATAESSRWKSQSCRKGRRQDERLCGDDDAGRNTRSAFR